MTLSLLDSEVKRLLSKASTYGPETQWKQNEFSEILPFPKPLSLSVLRTLTGNNGATGMACRELGLPCSSSVPADDYLETVFGRTYVNTAAEKLLFGGSASHSFVKNLISSTKLQKGMKLFYREFDEITSRLDTHFKKINRSNFETLSEPELAAKIKDILEVLNKHYRYVVKAGLLAKFCLDDISAKTGMDDAAHLASADSRKIFNKNKEALNILHFRENELQSFDLFSAEIDYELSCPRFIEKKYQFPSASTTHRESSLPIKIPKGVDDALFLFKVYESLKVIFKTMLLRELYILRLALLELGAGYGLQEDIFYLDLDQILKAQNRDFKKRIEEKKELEQAFQPVHVPTVITPSELPVLLHGDFRKASHDLKGICVNGFEFEGKALLYDSEKDLELIEPDTILVSRYASPNLVIAFSRARGVIAETGGMLSHLAIVAREQRFPLVLQASDATDLIKNGDHLIIDEKGKISVA